MSSRARITAFLSLLCCMFISSFAAFAQEDASITPLRLSYAEGSISFLRYGAENWVDAQRNTPLAAGDELYVGDDADLEVQLSNRAFIRADDDTHLSVVNQEADFLQLKITTGRVSLDLRSLPDGYSIELDTPYAVFNIEHAGYYRLDVDGDAHFITRRGGRATLTPSGGEAMSIHPAEEIVVQGTAVASAETYVAPPLDEWDRWNYQRSEELIEAVSERYLPPGISGAHDLDRYGSWRVVPEYGAVWVPDGVASGWVPYSTGRWIWDPYFQWSWIDDAPWGWAPFHYGRWVNLSGYWAWAPGPVVVSRPVYAPALVAFFASGSGLSVGFSISNGNLGWVALSWGEPVVPWWGRTGFAGKPWWGGWGGPRVVNNVLIRKDTHIDIDRLTYRNAKQANAMIVIRADHFGRGHVRDTPRRMGDEHEFQHLRGALPLKPDALSAVGGINTATRPPQKLLTRAVVTTRAPQLVRLPWRVDEAKRNTRSIEPIPHYVPRPKPATIDLKRPEFGTQTGGERPRPQLPLRYKEQRRQVESAAPKATREQAEQGRIQVMPSRPVVRETVRGTSEPAPVNAPRARSQEKRESGRETTPAEPRSSTQRERAEERQGAELPGKPANQMLRRQQEQERGERRRSKTQEN